MTEPSVSERNETKLAVIGEKVNNIEKDMGEVKDSIKQGNQDQKELISKIENHYVTRTEFAPVKMIVFGLIGLIVVAVIGAVVSLVVRQ